MYSPLRKQEAALAVFSQRQNPFSYVALRMQLDSACPRTAASQLASQLCLLRIRYLQGSIGTVVRLQLSNRPSFVTHPNRTQSLYMTNPFLL